MAQLVKNQPANVGDAGDAGLIPGLGRSPGEGNDNPLQYSFLENSMDREVWWATVQGVTKSQTWLRVHVHTHTIVSVYYQDYFRLNILCGSITCRIIKEESFYYSILKNIPSQSDCHQIGNVEIL